MNTTLTMLIEQKFQLLNTFAYIGMTWWVSSVVFCGSAIGAIWLKRDEIGASAPLFSWLGAVLGVFFGSVVLFGVWMIISVIRISKEIENLLVAVQATSYSDNFGAATVAVGYGIGTSSFIIITVAWIVLWLRIKKNQGLPSTD